jgi:Na+-transporting NADH:ubiquinone oxidoreductase subunit A
VVILADKEQQYRSLPSLDLATASREDLVSFLLDSGVWPMFRQRPFDVMADPQRIPDHIFVSTFDSAPLAPDLDFVVQGSEAAFQQGLDVLGRLTAGQVHLGLNAGGDTPPAKAFREATGVQHHWFKGKHPAGNVGVQIHHIAPLGPGRCVWTMGVQEVITLGKLFTEQRFHAERLVALTGAELSTTAYVRTFLGANIGDLLKTRLPEGSTARIVSGDVLSGKQQSTAGFLGFHDDQLTVLREGNEYQLFGWLLPDLTSPSASRALPGWVFPDSTYRADTNTKGEKRAFVVTGQYEEVLPMDIYPQHLMKAILTNNYDRMEGLGIYELIEEDVALCEFVCTSKQPLQQILRQGLDMVNEQG